MCGICGYITIGPPGQGGRPDREEDLIEAMCEVLRHRGPDEEGSFSDGSVALGHRRLSIIDLESGRQPLFSEDRNVVLVCNGEIYNHLDLRPELQGLGHRFSTNSDNEVLIHAYEQWGEDLFSRINGMFAFAIYDRHRRVLLLGRDRMGKKPLYYTLQGSTFVFASEIKALALHPAVRPELDIVSLCKYLAHEYVPTPRSILKGVMKLPGGSYLRLGLDRGGVDVREYWTCEYGPPPPERAGPDEARDPDYYCERIETLLREAVSRRLMSDVPLGVFLSGGIDSSLVVYFMSRILPPEQIKTFSIGFEERSFDERRFARTVAQSFGTDHYEEVFGPSAMLSLLDDVVANLDEPFADASVLPTFLLSRFTRQEVTVALGGDGGDELFAGYPTFQAHRIAGPVVLPSILKDALLGLAHLIPVSTKNISREFQIKQFLRGMCYAPEVRNQVWLGAFTPPALTRLLRREVYEEGTREGLYSEIESYLDHVGSRERFDRILYLYTRMYLQDDILVKVDRASMANSLEVRAPFLDVNVVDFCNRIPWRLKLRGLTTKYILKRAMQGRLAEEIVHRPKKGFGIPIARWFKSELKEQLLEALDERRIRSEGLFEAAYVTRLVDEHLAGKRDHRKLLWTLFMFQKWREQWGWA